MGKSNFERRRGAGATKLLVLLLVICLAECTTEERINSRGSKSSNLIEKVNGWRSQRGGSCLSYGHSCWGAHGKRSGKPPASAPDWYLTRILQRIAANAEMNRARQATQNDDISAIFQVDMTGEAPETDRLMAGRENTPVDIPFSRDPEAKPMLDENLLSQLKIWQIMRDTPEVK